ncbi:hypothetical protein [Acinetobacter beijerinckii]|uniref:hypothetical protein n=1 Tax=Acinetobacter beijerinckii TaxID=262668 RepID=UPI003016975C
MTTINTSRTTRPFNLDVGKTRKANAKVTTNTAYKIGDLLSVSAANVLTHAADASTWSVICGATLTAAEATIAAANNTEIPIYIAGIYSVEAVSISGTALATNQYAATRAQATKNNIELAKV